MNLHWLMRLRVLLARPLSRKRINFLLAILAFCAIVVLIERLAGGWPEALTPDFQGRGRSLPRWPG